MPTRGARTLYSQANAAAAIAPTTADRNGYNNRIQTGGIREKLRATGPDSENEVIGFVAKSAVIILEITEKLPSMKKTAAKIGSTLRTEMCVTCLIMQGLPLVCNA